MRMGTRSLVAMAAMLLVVSPALAQRPGGGGRGMGMGGPGLVGIPAVQEELGITEEQTSQLEPILAEVRTAMQGLREKLQDVPAEERMARGRELMEEANAKAHEKLAGILKPEQSKRLQQIELQVRGAEAFLDAKVHEGLALTDEQKEKISGLVEEAATKRREIMQDAQGDFQGAMTRMRELGTETLGKVKELLTDEQKGKWQEMTGEPFELRFGGPGGGPGGGGRPPRTS